MSMDSDAPRSRCSALGAGRLQVSGRRAIMEKTMSQRVQNLLLSGFVALGLMAVCPAQQNQSSGGEANAHTKAQAKEPSKQQSQQKEAEPPEEDDSAKPTEYAFNPLQADKELK